MEDHPASAGEGSRFEELLQRSEARYQALVENVPAIVYEMLPDDDRRTFYISPRVEEFLGYTREEWEVALEKAEQLAEQRTEPDEWPLIITDDFF